MPARITAHLVYPFFEQRIVGRGLATADVDDDGDLDLLVNTNDHRALFIECKGRPNRNWIGLKLVGAGKNPDALGARVEVHSGAGTQIREVRGASSFCSYHDVRLVVGLGDEESASITVRWPDGECERFDDLEACGYRSIRQGNGETVPK